MYCVLLSNVATAAEIFARQLRANQLSLLPTSQCVCLAHDLGDDKLVEGVASFGFVRLCLVSIRFDSVRFDWLRSVSFRCAVLCYVMSRHCNQRDTDMPLSELRTRTALAAAACGCAPTKLRHRRASIWLRATKLFVRRQSSCSSAS